MAEREQVRKGVFYGTFRACGHVCGQIQYLIDKAKSRKKMIKAGDPGHAESAFAGQDPGRHRDRDQHLLIKKQQENQQLADEWVRKAELAVEKEHDDLRAPRSSVDDRARNRGELRRAGRISPHRWRI